MLPSSSCTSMLQAEIKHAPRKSSRDCTGWQDCAVFYSLETVNCSARFPSVNEPVRDELAHAHAKQSCANTTRTQSSGGWCLVRLSEAVRPVHCCANLMPVDESQGVERSYYLPAHHYPPDARMIQLLRRLLSSPRRSSLIDFGAGVGQYCTALLGFDRQQRCASYDGAGNVEEVSNGFVKWVDMTTPLSLPRADWVMSLEVGEHIPYASEPMFIRNLHAHNCRGIILSWGHKTRGKVGHDDVNYHTKAHLISIFQRLGYQHVNVTLFDDEHSAASAAALNGAAAEGAKPSRALGGRSTRLAQGLQLGPGHGNLFVRPNPAHFWITQNFVGVFERSSPAPGCSSQSEPPDP